jgi:hypothetical protein
MVGWNLPSWRSNPSVVRSYSHLSNDQTLNLHKRISETREVQSVGRLVKVEILWFDLSVLLSFMWDVIQLILDEMSSSRPSGTF